MERTRRAFASIAAIAALLAAPCARAAPTQADMDEAKRHYARGVELYNQGVDAGALAELERAYALAPNHKVLYNIGLVQLQLNDFAGALRAFEQYLKDGGAEVAAARRTEVEGRIAQLRDRVATIGVAVDVSGADVTLDDVSVGTSPLAKELVVNPGHHKIGASMAGHEPESKVLSVAGADRARVELTLPPIPVTPAPSPTPTPTPAEVTPRVAERPVQTAPIKESSASYLWIGWVGTGALATGAIVTGLAALNANQDLSRAKTDGPSSGARLDDMATKARSFAIASDILTVSAIAAAGVTLYFTIKPRHHAASVSDVRLGVTGSSIAVRGSF
jgi:hypothetical protein